MRSSAHASPQLHNEEMKVRRRRTESTDALVDAFNERAALYVAQVSDVVLLPSPTSSERL